MGRITSFITGAAIGAVAALLLAPQTGEQTRTLVIEKANAVTGEAKDFGAGIPATAQDAFKSVQDKATDIVSDVTGRAKGVAGQVAPAASTAADDELREKIEAARQRIAAQVKENAEQSKAAMAATVEAVQEQAEEAVSGAHAQ